MCSGERSSSAKLDKTSRASEKRGLLTSNNTRELSEALKRRCLYLFIDYPTVEAELAVVRLKVPDLNPKLARQAVEFVQGLRKGDMRKAPSISETLDWANALVALNAKKILKARGLLKKAYERWRKWRKSGKCSKETGSYTNIHASGNRYHGKGSPTRSQQTGKQIANKHDDPHVATDWTPAENDLEAFLDEAARIQLDDGVENLQNYNKINSPGHRFLEEAVD